MCVPAPVHVSGSIGVPTMAGPRVNPGFSTRRAAGDASRPRERQPDVIDPLVARPVTAKRADANRSPMENNTLTYVIGKQDLQIGRVTYLGEFAVTGGWHLAGVRADADEERRPSRWPGLATALASLRTGSATLLVLDQNTYEPAPACLGLRVAVRHVGRVLCMVTGDAAGSAEVAVTGFEPGTTPMQVVRPSGSCREDLG